MNIQIASAIVFSLVALLHLWRVIRQLPFVIGTWEVPQALSVVAVIVAGTLAYLNMSARQRR